MTIGPETVVRRGNLPTARVLDAEMFMNVEAGEYQMLSGTARDVWLLIDGQRSVRQIVDSLVAEYDVDTETCLGDVTALLMELGDIGMIEIAA